MALVSFAVIVFFKRNPGLAPSRSKALLAPLVRRVLLAIIAYARW